MANREIPLIDLTLFTSDTPWITIDLTGIYTFLQKSNELNQISELLVLFMSFDDSRERSTGDLCFVRNNFQVNLSNTFTRKHSILAFR